MKKKRVAAEQTVAVLVLKEAEASTLNWPPSMKATKRREQAAWM